MANGAILGQTFAPAPLSGNRAIYVDASTGSDSNPGTQSSPFASIQKAIDSIPKNLGGYSATINIAAGTYNEAVDISSFYGASRSNVGIWLIGASADSVFITGGIRCANCKNLVLLRNISVSGYIPSTFGSISAYVCNHVYLVNVNVDGSLLTQTSHSVHLECTDASIYGVQISNSPNVAIMAISCTAYIGSISGSNNQIGVVAGSNSAGFPGLVIIGSNNLNATTRYQKAMGGVIIENGALIDSLQTCEGYYIGTGEYGDLHPNSITFPFTPQLVFLSPHNGDTDYLGSSFSAAAFPYIWGTEVLLTQRSSFTSACPASTSGNTLTYYGSDPRSQFNVEGVRYDYKALV